MCDSLVIDAQIFIFTTVVQNKAGNRRYKTNLFSNKSNTKFTWLLFRSHKNLNKNFISHSATINLFLTLLHLRTYRNLKTE